jgi:hypothetical protein
MKGPVLTTEISDVVCEAKRIVLVAKSSQDGNYNLR